MIPQKIAKTTWRIPAGLLLVDQLTKLAVGGATQSYQFGPVQIGAVYNREGVFGLAIPNLTLLIIGIIICGVLGWLLTKPHRKQVRFGIWLLLAGSAGNTIDRLLYGGVLDIAAIGPSGHFNLADIMIISGALLLAATIWLWKVPVGRT